MVASASLNAAEAAYESAACYSTSHTLVLSPSPFLPSDDVTVLPTRSSDPGRSLLSLAKNSNVPSQLLLPSDPIPVSRLASHLPDLLPFPVVISVACTSDHSPVTNSLRTTGLITLFSGSAAQAQINALVATKIAKSLGRAVLHFFEVEEQSQVKPLTKTQLTAAKKYISSEVKAQSNGVHKANGVNGHANGANGINGANGTNGVEGDHEEEPQEEDTAAKDLENKILQLIAALPKSLGSAASYTYTAKAKPTSAIIALGSSTSVAALDVSDTTAILSLSLLSPLTSERLLNLVPPTVENIVVLEQSYSKITELGGPLLLEVLNAFSSAQDRELPHIVGRPLGKMGAVNATSVKNALKEALSDGAAFEGQPIGDIVPVAGQISELRVPKHESAYNKILDTIFGERLNIINAIDASQDTAETTIPSSLPVQALGKFLASQKELASKSNWIIGSDAWAYDLGTSGVHHALSSGANINLLILDSQPYEGPESVADPERRAKKDIGLYAMNYGNAYVASVAVYGDYSQVVRAFQEADSFKGPSVVVAYLPKGGKDSSRALDILKETKNAIDSGFWPLYRWNPAKEAARAPDEHIKAGGRGWNPLDDRDAFQLDSERIKADMRAFLDRQTHLTLLARKNPVLADSITDSLGNRIRDATEAAALAAFEKIQGATDGPSLLVLYASDGGNADKLAKRFTTRARARGLGARVQVLDSFSPDDLALEPNVVFVTSTAGQGEFPVNGRLFWKALSKHSNSLGPSGGDGKNFDQVRYSVFGMGDSHYWPRPEDAHYYNKPAKDLDAKIKQCGAQTLTEIGLGDDQDADGYQTGYKEWEARVWQALGVDTIEVVEAEPEPITNEHIKIASNYLRGTIAEGLQDTSTGALAESDGQLTKFHGIYQQDDRDIREQRREQGLEPAYSFMVRVRMPAGICKPDQWEQIDAISDARGNHTFKLTTRQTFQFHGIVKGQLKPAIQEINKALLDTIAACGDVNRNVMCGAYPSMGKLHAQVAEFAKNISEHLMPQTAAYAEIWLDKKQITGEAVKAFVEPLYGKYYLPRKFKVAIAVPPHNDVDVFCNDVGLIAIQDPATGELQGFNVSIGGGMGVTHAMKATYPRLGSIIGFTTPDKAVDVVEKIMLVQRDNGNRANRKNARLKYTIDRMGLDNYKAEVEKYLGYTLQPARDYHFDSNVDEFGWTQGEDGKHHCTVFIENGRVEDAPGKPQKTGLREIAKIHKGVFRLTGNQHVIISDVDTADKPEIARLMKEYKLDKVEFSGLRLSSSACVAFPTCGLAMAESERFLPHLIDRVEKVCEEVGLRHDSIVMRVTGCPNGCARPYAAEVAFVGKAPNSYLMLLGGGYFGQRLNKIYREAVSEDEIVEILTPMLKHYATKRLPGERFGDFTIRQGWISATTSGKEWYDGMTEGKPVEAI